MNDICEYDENFSQSLIHINKLKKIGVKSDHFFMRSKMDDFGQKTH